jgi:hypothetical protein
VGNLYKMTTYRKLRRGFSLVSVLIGAGIGAFVLLGLFQVFTQFQAVSIADTRESELRTLLQLANLSLSPNGRVVGSQNSCDAAFSGTAVTTPTFVVTPPPTGFRLSLGVGTGSDFIQVGTEFGPWRVNSISLEFSECKTLASPASAPVSCNGVTGDSEFFGFVALNLSSPNPLTKVVETKIERFPMKLFATSSDGINFSVTGCRSPGSGGGGGTTPTPQAICQSICATCWNTATSTCNLASLICDSFGSSPTTTVGGDTVCNLSSFRQNDLRTTSVTGCSPPNFMKGFRFVKTGLNNINCSGLSTTQLCANCWIAANSPGTLPGSSSYETGLTCDPGETKWLHLSGGGTVNDASCGMPFSTSYTNDSICAVRRNQCTNTF